MPFKFRWPFRWPRRQPASDASSTAAPAAATPGVDRRPVADHDLPAPVQLAGHEQPLPAAAAAPPLASNVPIEPVGPDLGLELLSRLPALSTPPTLGRLGGLPAMAQTLPTVERFLRTLPVPPPQPTLPGLGAAAEFAASLPALAGYAETGSGPQAPAFPAQLEPPSEPTDVLAPPGGMPGQIAGLSGAAAVLEPTRLAAPPPLATPIPARETAAPTATAPVVPSAQRITESASAPPRPAAPISVSPTLPAVTAPQGLGVTPIWTQPPLIITQVLTPEQTLTGNVLPKETTSPVQRELLRDVGEEWALPAELARPAEPPGERVSAEQRQAIESQRGQGRPLEPETRQRFEQAYGQPLDDVRIHTGPTAHSTAESLNAIAFASGRDLFFTHNTYAPDSRQGLSLIGHELAHVIQQQYGVPGDSDALRPPDDHYERQADQLSAAALETPLAQAPLIGHPLNEGGAVQRIPDEKERLPARPHGMPATSTWEPGEPLSSAAGPTAQPLPLASAMPLNARRPAEDEPIQRVVANSAGSAPSATAAPVRVSSPMPPNTAGEPWPSLASTPRRVGTLTEQLLIPSVMLSSRAGLSQNLPGLGQVSDAGQGLPVFRRISLPSLGGLPDMARGLPDLGTAQIPEAGALTDPLPSAPSLPGHASGLPNLGAASLGEAAPSMPDLSGVAQSLGGALPPMLGLPSGLPSLGGLTPPEMPLADGLGAAGQAAGEAVGGAASGALAAGQQALGTITGMAPSGGDAGPAAPALPSLDKLTEHVWKEVQRKLKVERERSRGLA